MEGASSMLKKIFSSKKEKRDISIDKQLDLNKLPQHVGIIMDGNGRWATGKGLIRTSGHKAGVKTLKKILKTCIKYNIPILTVYAFSCALIFSFLFIQNSFFDSMVDTIYGMRLIIKSEII